MNDIADETLIRQYRGGNAAAFDQLYERHRLPVYNYIFRQVKMTAQAEDIFQDVWFKVIQSLHQLDTPSQFPAWLFTIARNKITDHWRKKKPEPLENEDELESHSAVSEQIAFIRSCMERLLALLQTLKPEQRDAFVLQQESGLTLEEIASIAECGRETIKSRLRYAMQKLRKGLEGCDE
ncbi:MAG: sigma-70 family RNA polymerase sigma factor [Gammaproteobacteria bacterium]|nr:sigma-70 family RNA polymerase sigma factor [Gammaproteobacteria bacterium]